MKEGESIPEGLQAKGKRKVLGKSIGTSAGALQKFIVGNLQQANAGKGHPVFLTLLTGAME
jgi:hypothetical protein